MGAAIGIKLGCPEREVLCVTGDGSFIFGMPALHTAMKYHVPVGFIIINNSSYAAVKAGLLRYKGKAYQKGFFPGTDISGADYTTIAKGFGVTSFKVESQKEISIISKAMGKEKEPIFVEVLTDPTDPGRIER
jgi:benzoylformate decarboxylase